MNEIADRIRVATSRRGVATLVLEVLVVIVGILIAFQIDRWGEEWRDLQLEQEYLSRLKVDIAREIDGIDDATRYALDRIESVRLLEHVIADPELAAEMPAAVLNAVEKVSWRSFPQIPAFIYSELQSTGRLSLIRSQSLRDTLAAYYSTLRHEERVGGDVELQRRFDLHTSGILTTDELIAIENTTRLDEAIAIDAARAVEIARELADRPQALALLPGIAQHNQFVVKVMEANRIHAEELIGVINELLHSEQAASQ